MPESNAGNTLLSVQLFLRKNDCRRLPSTNNVIKQVTLKSSFSEAVF